MVVLSTIGEVAVGVCETVREEVGGADRDITPVIEFELLKFEISFSFLRTRRLN